VQGRRPAGQERHADGLEESRAHTIHVHGHFPAVDHGDVVRVEAAEQRVLDERRGDDARRRLQPFQQTRCKRPGRLRRDGRAPAAGLRKRVRRVEAKHHEPAGIEARLDAIQIVQRPQEQQRRDDERHRDGDLQREQRAAQKEARRRRADHVLPEARDQAARRHAQRGRQAEQDRRAAGDDRGDGERPPVERQPRRIRAEACLQHGGDERPRHQREDETRGTAERGERQALGQQLPYEPAASGAERLSDRELALARHAARKQQRGQVDAGNEHDGGDDGRQHAQRPVRHAADRIHAARAGSQQHAHIAGLRLARHARFLQGGRQRACDGRGEIRLDDARRQAHHHAQPEHVCRAALLRNLVPDRGPQLRVCRHRRDDVGQRCVPAGRRQARELLGRHANDDERRVVDPDGAPDDRGIAAEGASPEAVREYHDARGRRHIIGRREAAAERHARPKHVEGVAGYEKAGRRHRRDAVPLDDQPRAEIEAEHAGGIVRDERAKGGVRYVRTELARGRWLAVTAGVVLAHPERIRSGPVQQPKLGGAFHAERVEQRDARGAIEGRARADTERKRHDGHRCKAGCARERSQRVPDIDDDAARDGAAAEARTPQAQEGGGAQQHLAPVPETRAARARGGLARERLVEVVEHVLPLVRPREHTQERAGRAWRRHRRRPPGAIGSVLHIRSALSRSRSTCARPSGVSRKCRRARPPRSGRDSESHGRASPLRSRRSRAA
jgi:hypothetical protein